MEKIAILAPVLGVAALLFAASLSKKVSKQDTGTERMKEISEFIHDLRAPGQQFRSQRPPPLIERNPVLFWQASTLVLALVALALAFRQA